MIETAAGGHVARITLAAPERHNALDRAGIAAFHAALDALQPEARVLVITGRGKSFCAGAALGDVGASDWTENPLTALCDRIEALAMPTVCALNGGVYGGGVELALSCDFRIGVTGMRMFAPPAELGIHYPPEGMARAERLLGLRLTRQIFLLARRFGDAELLEAGFLDELVAPEGLEAATGTLVDRITALAPLAVQGMKLSLYEHGRGSGEPDAVRARIAACFASEDHAEALAARAQKRPPVFRGR
ncbi:enoyl-CoA hydratase/isomerase family protein [Halovulum dunhuangense]|uniref:Enoyl-CoA hydratase/isomerase family protein n=1 Tax=Halovulum dunhuangense TaxID=1505036 RepID=A0A849L019_9RHOB|nr:enoyl-CoA hydratase/isomerase family protein [Halovulum dunhuangense]